MDISRFRDLTMIHINDKQLMVIACDSSGGIGNKDNDVVKVSPETVGFFTTQVALMEVLAIGAKPVTVVNALAVEMDPTGVGIIEGVKQAIKPLKLDVSQIITGSTEENIPVNQTAMGLTIIAMIEKGEWIQPKTYKGNIAIVVGIPKVGDEVVIDRGREILSIELLMELKKDYKVNEILPVGSKGILYEAKEMAETNDLEFVLNDDINIDIKRSAGPSTCAVVSIDEKEYNTIKDRFPIPVNKIGEFK